MTLRLIDRCAVVTGAGRGIGREISMAMAAEGAKVVVNDPGVAKDGTGSAQAPADEVVAEIKKTGGTAIANYDSVTDFTAASRIVNCCVENFGRIDILINCAGVLRDRMLHNMTEEEWDAVIDIHLKGTFNMSRHASALMRTQRYGRIINMASAAFQGSLGQANYSAAKGGIISLTRTSALELGRYGVTCNCIVPMASTRLTMDDVVKTKFKRQYDEGVITKARYEEIVNMPGPEFIAPIVVYLASEAAGNINGLLFRSAGGIVGVYSEPVINRIIHRNVSKDGKWGFDDLADLVPKILLAGYVNPAPPQPEEKGK